MQAWVYEHSPATGNDRLVLLAIADEADDDGTNAYPSVDRIAHKARLNKRTTMRCLERLEADGGLIVHRPEKRGRGHFNTYMVVMVDRSVKGDRVAPIPEGQTSAQNGATDPEEKARKGDTKARKGAPQGCTRPTDPQTHRPEGANAPDSSTQSRVAPAGSTPPEPSSETVEAERLCHLFADLLGARNGCTRPSVTKAWVVDMERLLRIDGRTSEAVERTLRWLDAAADDVAAFWRPNVRSPDKLRAKWDQMLEQYETRRKLNGNGNGHAAAQSRGDAGFATARRAAARYAAEGRDR